MELRRDQAGRDTDRDDRDGLAVELDRAVHLVVVRRPQRANRPERPPSAGDRLKVVERRRCARKPRLAIRRGGPTGDNRAVWFLDPYVEDTLTDGLTGANDGMQGLAIA